LPGAKIGLPALLIEVGEQRAQQQSDNAGNDYDTGGDVIHETGANFASRFVSALREN
jgi:hypothetical protein